MARFQTDSTITIDIEFGRTYHYWNVIGAYFTWSSYPDNYAIKAYIDDGTGWVTLKAVTDGSNTDDFIYWAGGQSYVSILRFQFWGRTNNGKNRIDVGLLFGTAGSVNNGYYTYKGGDIMYGDLDVNGAINAADVDISGVMSADGLGGTAFKRQGGSSTTWRSPGTTGYTPSDMQIQFGTEDVTVAANNEAEVTITFPDAFLYTPIVLASVLCDSGIPYAEATTWLREDSGDFLNQTIRIRVFNHYNIQRTLTVQWVAFGPRA
jgi:hypothetical protein